VILSGTATDGTFGLKAIKAEGGICFAQDEESAKYPGMPASAIAAGCVDFALPPRKIAAELTRIARHQPLVHLSPPPAPLLLPLFQRGTMVTFENCFSCFVTAPARTLPITNRAPYTAASPGACLLKKIGSIREYVEFLPA